MAVCAAAEVVGRYQAAVTHSAAGIASESVGGQSVTYRSSTEWEVGKRTEIGQAVSLYLPLSPSAAVCGGVLNADERKLHSVYGRGERPVPAFKRQRPYTGRTPGPPTSTKLEAPQ